MGHVGPISTRSLDEILGYISPLSHMGSEGLRSQYMVKIGVFEPF